MRRWDLPTFRLYLIVQQIVNQLELAMTAAEIAKNMMCADQTELAHEAFTVVELAHDRVAALASAGETITDADADARADFARITTTYRESARRMRTLRTSLDLIRGI